MSYWQDCKHPTENCQCHIDPGPRPGACPICGRGEFKPGRATHGCTCPGCHVVNICCMACLYEHLKKHWVVYSDLLEACRSVVEWEASDGSAEPTPEVAERYMEMMAKVVSSIAKAEGS